MVVHGEPIKQLTKQMEALFEVNDLERQILESVYPDALKSMNVCFARINNKYYHKDEETFFNIYHVGQWTMFLYLISRQIHKSGLDAEAPDLSSKIYFLLKTISSADIFYQVEMPEIWFFDHPQASVIGRANYSNYFTFSQGCTVGNNKGKYPSFGEHVSMFSNSKVLGDCHIGHHVIIAANTYIKDETIGPYSMVFGSSPNLIIKPISEEYFNKVVGPMFK